MVHILDKAFLFMVEDVNLVCSIDEKDVFQVVSLSFIPFEVKIAKYSDSNLILDNFCLEWKWDV